MESLQVVCSEEDQDKFCWLGTLDGSFTIKFSMQIIREDVEVEPQKRLRHCMMCSNLLKNSNLPVVGVA